MKIPALPILAVAACGLAAALCFSPAPAMALCLSDLVRPPVDISLSGYYYSDRSRAFSLEVSPDRFIKSYRDGLTIIGLKESDSISYYIVDAGKKTVLKISQANLYRTGQFFNWSSMTTLLELPGTATVIRRPRKAEGCTSYQVAGSDLELCVDESRHLLRTMTKKGEILARVVSVEQLVGNLKERSSALILGYREQGYNFLDLDSELSADAD